ncbi:hypothetical protein C5S29_03795, partial [ANME-1 cluster archaeon GoMg3.2]|nr:hypothetical protein [ANME-1 cluster archaeon GoMg3.2]
MDKLELQERLLKGKNHDKIPISRASLGSLDIDHFRTFLKKYLA